MKNPLTILDELFTPSMTETCLTFAATLEFCYDHLEEDTPLSGEESPPLADQNISSRTEIRETE